MPDVWNAIIHAIGQRYDEGDLLSDKFGWKMHFLVFLITDPQAPVD